MPTFVTHGAVAASICALAGARAHRRRVWLAAAGCAVAPDLDVIGLALGVPYGHVLGHRGLTHSVPFALALGAVVAPLVAPAGGRMRTAALLAAVTATHGLLDACTDGGLGVAFWAPFDATRTFAPFRPLRVSPLSVSGLTNPYFASVLASELLWVWLPAGVLAAGARGLRALRR